MLGFASGIEHRRGMSGALLARSGLSGIPFPGKVLTASGASQWFSDDVPIAGETGAAYTVGVGDIGKMIRCGNSRPVGIWHPRHEPAVGACFLPWEGVLNAVGPDAPSQPGQTVRRWVDVVNGIPVDQVTANLQPMLGYAAPPPGNLIRFSEPVFTGNEMTGWNKSQPTVVTVSNGDIPGPSGESTVRVDFSMQTPETAFGAQTTTSVEIGRFKVFAWVKRATAVSTRVHFRWSGVGSGGATTLETDDWTLISHDGISTVNSPIMIVAAQIFSSAAFYVGRVWIVKPEWSSDYVPTSGTAVVPDPSGLARAIVFDGDNDLLSFSGAGLSLFSGVSYRSVVAAVEDTNRTGGSDAHFPFHAAQPAPNNVAQFSIWTRNVANTFGAEARNTYDSAVAAASKPSLGGMRVICGEADGLAGQVRLLVDNEAPVITAAAVGATSPHPASGMGMGNHWSGGGALPGRIAALTLLREVDGAVPELTRDRIRQFSGLCAGINLELPVV